MLRLHDSATSGNAYKVRLLLTHLAKEPSKTAEILSILKPLRLEKEHYIKKAIAWIDKDLGRL